jgi:hypothetical protein
VVIASKFARERVCMNVRELKVEPALVHLGGKNFPGGGQSAGEVAEREVRVPACEKSINGSPDKHKGVVWATRASCSRETRCSAAKWGDTTTRTRVSTLACQLSRARACGCVHLFG